MAGGSVVFGIAGRPYPGEQVSGDDWQLDHHAHGFRVSMIDGLGHGQPAANAAAAAKALLASRPELGPVEALRACHAALFSTRGAAMWIANVYPTQSKLTYAGVGNVDARLWQEGRQHRLVAQRGIVGAALPTVRLYEVTLKHHWVLLVHTDGVREHFDADSLPDLLTSDPQAMADGILLAWGRPTDDALVLVARLADEPQSALGCAAG
jgi:serine phosphatase RsbU (regulator of sigma subunit)